MSVHNPGLRFTNDPEAIESQFERIDDVIMGGRYPALIPKKNGFGLVRKEACVDLTERTPSRFVPFQVGLCFAWMLLCKLYALYLHSAGSMRKGYSILIFFWYRCGKPNPDPAYISYIRMMLYIQWLGGRLSIFLRIPYLVGGLEHFFIFPYIGNSHPN